MTTRIADLSSLLRLLLAIVMLATSDAGATTAAPAPVSVGIYLNNVQDVTFKEGRVTLDFYIWFRWQDDYRLESYFPLKSMELINGKIEEQGSVVRKFENGVHYASARVTATIYKTWDIELFPFDRHSLAVNVEDSEFDAKQLVFVVDDKNSDMGDEVRLAGWVFSKFRMSVAPKAYRTNYGEIGREQSSGSTYSRLSFMVDMRRDGLGPAVKLLMTACVAAMVAFVAFGIKPTDVDPRFGLGVGSLFAVAASAFVVASTVPDSAVLTIADKIHLLAVWFIFASLVQSVFCLRWDEAGRDSLYRRVDAMSLILFPLSFVLLVSWIISGAFR